MNVQVRSRRRRSPMADYYKEDAAKMREDPAFREKTRDRVAYIYVTGHFPSHLRKPAVERLRPMTAYSRRPVALDGRSGNMRVHPAVVDDLELDAHPMVRTVREKIRLGYFIQPSRGLGTRRNYWKTYMFRLNADGIPFDLITVQADSSIKAGW